MKAKLGALLPRGRFARGVSWVAGGAAIHQLLTLALLPLLSRLYSPEEFGVLGAYLAVVATVQSVVGLRYELAIPLAPTDRDAVSLLLVALSVVATFALVALVVAALFGFGVVPRGAATPLGETIWLLPVGLVVTGVYQTLYHWALRVGGYRDIGTTRITQGIGRGVVQAGSGWLGGGVLGLVAGEIVGQSAGVLRLARSASRAARRFWGEIGWSEMLSTARRFSSFPILMAPASLLNGAGLQLPMLLIAALFGTEVAGWYYVTQRALSVPLQLSSGAFGQVFLGEAAPLARKEPAELARLFRSVSRGLLWVGLPPTLAAVFLGPWAMALLLGPEWRPSGVFLQWLAPAFLLKLAYDGLINLAMVNRQDYSLIWAATRLALTSAAVLVAHRLGLSATACVALLGIALTLGYLLKLLLWRRAIHQLQTATP